MVWKNVAVKEDVKKIIDEISKKRGIKRYQVVELAIRQFAREQKYRRDEKEYHCGYDIDRELWYAFKLVNSIAQLKHAIELKLDDASVKRYVSKTFETISQIENRLGVDLSNVKTAINKFLDTPNGKMSANLNDETKMAMARIIFS